MGTLQAVERLKMAAVTCMKKVDDQLPETAKNDNQLYKMITWLKN